MDHIAVKEKRGETEREREIERERDQRCTGGRRVVCFN
jgi:hypothetical protein